VTGRNDTGSTEKLLKVIRYKREEKSVSSDAPVLLPNPPAKNESGFFLTWRRLVLVSISAAFLLIAVLGGLVLTQPALKEKIAPTDRINVYLPQPTAIAPTAAVNEVKVIGVKVVGNRDSKRYHLPGMKYYHEVEAYHRVEFASEAEAVRAGYYKASR